MSTPDFLVLTLVYFVFFYKRWKEKGRDIFVSRTLMYVYICFVIFFTLMPIIAHIPLIRYQSYRHMNMNPFEDIILCHGGAVSQIILNIFMTVPFGILYPMTHNKRKFAFIRTIAAVFVFSLVIELIQPIISNRTSDITDVITNTLGGVIGFLIYIIFKKPTRKILRKIKKEKPN